MSNVEAYDTDVAIIGAGPTGLTLAMDLAWRGISSMVFEKRGADDPAHPKCNTTAARSMEILRRLGCDQQYRRCGLPANYANDVVYATRVVGGYELGRLKLPASAKRWSEDRFALDGGWPSSERPHRASQMYLEKVLREHAATFERVDLNFKHELCDFLQDADSVSLKVKDLQSGHMRGIKAHYMVGCDGGRSFVRRACDIDMVGGEMLGRVWGVFLECDEVLERYKQENRADDLWMSYLIDESGVKGTVVAIDGVSKWLVHVGVPFGMEWEQVDYVAGARKLLGVEGPLKVLAAEPWQVRKALAEHYRKGRVFLAGDAAHSWPPYAGFGMNSGMEDAITLSWMLAGVRKGWALPTLLDAYEAERRPVGELVAQAAEDMHRDQKGIVSDLQNSFTLEGVDKASVEMRAYIGSKMVLIDSQQYDARGLNFGVPYAQSPVIHYDRGVAPEFSVSSYSPSTVPGCRAPYFVTAAGVPLYDLLGEEFTLLVKDNSLDISAFREYAIACGMDLKVLSIAYEPKAKELYDYQLVLARPDQRVAWRADTVPENVPAVLDLVRGVIE